MEQLNNRFTIVDENNKEIEMEILLTFNYEGKDYVLYFDPNDNKEEVELFAAIYDESFNLTPVESEEEWGIVEDVYNQFLEQDSKNTDN